MKCWYRYEHYAVLYGDHRIEIGERVASKSGYALG